MNQELDRELGSEPIEIRTPLRAWLAVAPLVLFLCGCGVLVWIMAVWPQVGGQHPPRTPDLVGVRLFLFFIGAPFAFGLGLIPCWLAHYCLRADGSGLTEASSSGKKQVFWSDVASYSMELSHSEQSKARSHIVPIFRDAQGKVLFSTNGLANKSEATVERFRSFVQSHLPGKETSRIPDQSQPDN